MEHKRCAECTRNKELAERYDVLKQLIKQTKAYQNTINEYEEDKILTHYTIHMSDDDLIEAALINLTRGK